MHLPELISDLGFILITAAAVTLVFRYLKQPVVLGYLVAGFLVGPHVPFIPTITEVESIRIWAEIGVIFLLFGLGLEFSFKKLAQVGKTATITAATEVIFMLGLGYLAGQVFGWPKMDSLFLGGILAISSTTIIVRAFEELGLKSRRFVQIVFGVLIVEDLFAILLLVLLSTVAVTQTLSGSELLISTFRLGFFLILWFLVGIYVLPGLMKKVRGHLNDETTLTIALGLCLTMVMLATHLGFSPALGAFVMGSLLAETQEGKRIEHLIVPVRDLFAAVFFVSVGMLIDPKVIWDNGGVILAVTVLTIVGKFISTGIGTLLSGQNLKTSVQTGMSLAQIGEFSFIIATLGLSLGVISDFLYPVAVAVSAITTFTTPYMIKYSDDFYFRLNRYIPTAFSQRFEQYQYILSNRSPEQNLLSLLWRAYGIKLSLNAVLIIAISLGLKQWILPALSPYLANNFVLHFFMGLLALVLAAPFLWAIIFSGPANIGHNTEAETDRLKALQFGVTLFRNFMAIILVGFVISQFSSAVAVSGLILLPAALLVVFLSRYAEPFYQSVENDFIANLNEREKEQKNQRPQLAPWDATLSEMTLSPNSDLTGKSLRESALKEHFGITIALIERGHKSILAPNRDELLFPYDRLFIIGTEEQLEKVRPLIEGPEITPLTESSDFGLESLLLSSDSSFAGRRIRESGFRECIHGLIVGVERGGERILNPDSSLILQSDDLIWTVGDQSLIRKLVRGELEGYQL